MYSNTIYILNNTIIEWFDILLNRRKKGKISGYKTPPPEQIKKKQKQHFIQMGQCNKCIQCD